MTLDQQLAELSDKLAALESRLARMEAREQAMEATVKPEGKTIRQWLEEIPEPYRTQAIENAHDCSLGYITETSRDGLFAAFTWQGSPQGHDYWIDFAESLKGSTP